MDMPGRTLSGIAPPRSLLLFAPAGLLENAQMANKFDDKWFCLSACFAEKQGMVLPVGTMLAGGWLLCEDRAGNQRWINAHGIQCDIIPMGQNPLAREDGNSGLVLPTGERMTVAEASKRMKPQAVRGVKLGDCLRDQATGLIWRLGKQDEINGSWVVLATRIPADIGCHCTPTDEKHIHALFGDCLIASWPDALDWLREKARQNGNG